MKLDIGLTQMEILQYNNKRSEAGNGRRFSEFFLK